MHRVLVALPGFLAVACCVGGLGASTAQAATLNIAGGQLVGASDVDVDGMLYNVEFVDGSCAALFDDCNDTAKFDFTDAATAELAAQALLDQVFLDGPLTDGSDDFDSDPSLTAGCTSDSCRAIIPFNYFSGGDSFSAWLAINGDAPVGPRPDLDGLTPSGNPASPTTNSQVFARFSVVPEPGTGLLLAAGLALLATRRRASAAR